MLLAKYLVPRPTDLPAAIPADAPLDPLGEGVIGTELGIVGSGHDDAVGVVAAAGAEG